MRSGELEETVAGDASDGGARPDTGLSQGDVVGRYVVLRKLGVGGMGIVFAAYDPELDRRVAIKLLRPRAAGSEGSSEGRTRLLREAQALAKLVHPNVVTVHDVGTLGDQVYVAMEFVEGKTLTKWLARTPAPHWREVIEILSKAGAGLAAAHEKQLLHRDFKPDNVMVGDDGRVLVMDFGLARPVQAASARRSRDSIDDAIRAYDSAGRNDLLNTDLTVVGTLMGTPAYMAPECLEGISTNESSDQFSFCVALWEGIHGERPFAGKTVLELASNVLMGKLQPPRRRVPRWLNRVVRQGLSAKPQARWPSMRALLAELERGQTSARRWGAGAAIAVVGASAAGLFGLQEFEQRRAVRTCEASGRQIEEVWGEPHRSQIHTSLAATGASYAQTTAEKAIPWLDRHAETWRAARIEACTNARVLGTWSEDTLDRALWCLEERRGELGALIEQLAASDERGLRRVVSSAAGLRAVEPCLDASVLHARPAPPTDRVHALREVRGASHRAEALLHAGHFDAALEAAEAALAEAEALAWPPLAATLRQQLGRAHAGNTNFAAAADSVERAYFEAARAGDVEIAFEAAIVHVDVLRKQSKLAQAKHWAELARLELARLGDDPLRSATLDATLASVMAADADHVRDRELNERALMTRERILGPRHPTVASSLNNLALAHKRAGEYGPARELLERVIELQREGLGEEHPDLASSMNNLGNTLQMAGEYDLALQQHERALEIRRRTLGPENTAVADSINNIAIIYDLRGDYDEAIELYTQGLELRTKAFGENHPRVAASLNNLATVHRLTGNYEEARALAQRALAIIEKSLGDDHPHLGTSLTTLAAIHRAEGDYEAALELHGRALELRESALGPDHPSVANTLNNIAIAHRSAGDLEAATVFYRRALAANEKTLGPQHPSLSGPLLGLAQIALEEGRADDALPLAERALALREKEGSNDADMADASFTVARALSRVGEDRPRAARLAERSLQLTDDDEFTATVRGWIADHPPP